MEAYTVLVEAGHTAKPETRPEVSDPCGRDQGPSRHMCHMQGFSTYPGASRLAGLLLTEGPHGRLGS